MTTGVFITKFNCYECNEECGALISMEDTIEKARELKRVSQYLCRNCMKKLELELIDNNPHVKIKRVNRDGTVEDITGLK